MKIAHKSVLGTMALGLCVLAAQPAHAQALGYLGQQHVATGFQYNGTVVGGLSSIDLDAATGRFFAISDDRSAANPARYYTLDLDLTKFQRSASPGMAGVSFTGVTTILTPAGAAFGLNQVDPEGMRLDAKTGTLYWSNEGQRSGAGLQDPTVREMKLDGSHVRDFAVPANYGTATGLPGTQGIRNNLAFESVAISSDGKTLWTATENALIQDGPVATTANGSAVRMLSFDIATGAAGKQFIVNTDPVAIAPQPAGGFATNGLTDLLALNAHQFIGIERSFAAGANTPGAGPNGLPTGNTIKLVLIDIAAATDVSGMEAIDGTVVAASKTELLNLSTLKNDDGSFLATDNIEGLSFGPMVDGKRTLILVSDNNFSPTQFTQFVALSVNAPIPEPQTYALLLAGLGLVAGAARRRNAGARAGQGAPGSQPA
jgi:hypothetical protein